MNVTGFALFCAFAATTSLLPYRVAEAPRHLGTTFTSLLYISNLAGVISLGAGALSERLGRRLIVLAGALAMAAGLLLMLVPRVELVIGGLVLLTAGFFATQSAAAAYIGDHAGARKGAASAAYMACYFSGGALGPLALGLVWERAGWESVVLSCAALLALGCANMGILCGAGRAGAHGEGGGPHLP